jgi:SAM-dependent methyltransferase
MTGFSERSEGVRIGRKLHRETPWGPEFGRRRNFEGGYFTVERQFVEKYLKKPSSVLVFGSGNGREARPIAGDGHRIVCFDIGFLYVKGGSLLCAREGLGNIHFLQADMYALPFASETFDFVFFTLYSVAGERRFEVLHSIREILRPKGIVLLITLTPLYRRLLTPDTVLLSEEEMAEEIVNMARCGFRFHESSVDPIRNGYRFAVLEAC